MRSFTFLLFPLLLVLGACNHSVTFAPHAPYTTKNKIDAPLVIIVPDHADEVKYVAKQNKLYYKNNYSIYFGQALQVQATARLEPKMDRVFILTDSAYAYLLNVQPEGLEFIPAPGQKPQVFDPILPETLKAELEFTPDTVTSPIGYLMIIRRVQFAFEEGVGLYLMDVEFRNRETNEVVFNGIFRGKGKPMTGADSAYTYKIQINEAVSSAFAQAFTTIEDEIDKELLKK